MVVEVIYNEVCYIDLRFDFTLLVLILELVIIVTAAAVLLIGWEFVSYHFKIIHKSDQVF